MNDYDRILQACDQNGWTPRGLPSAMKYVKAGRTPVTARFDASGKIVEAYVQGRRVRSRVLPAVLQEMREG